MDRYGLIGKTLKHSFSPQYFKEKFEKENINAIYEAFELTDIAEFPALLSQHPDLKGLNVTIPYKEAVMPYLDEIDADALDIGAVNCIKISSGKTIGYNTDIIGFRESLAPLLEPKHKKALILGDGGAAKAVKKALKQLHLEYISVVRSDNIVNNKVTYQQLENMDLNEFDIIINTTPLGMHPDTTSKPDINYLQFNKNKIFYDLVYNPIQTEFLTIGLQQCGIIKNGLEMLHLQAEAGWRIWNK